MRLSSYMISLVELALKKQLPKHQYIDIATLKWIENNHPQNLKKINKKSISNLNLDKIIKYAPLKEWYLETKLIDSIHGQRHILRTLVLFKLLGNRQNLLPSETIEGTVALALHDIRRINDRETAEHGEKAAKWFLENSEKILRKFNLTDKINLNRIAYLIKNHDLQENYIEEADDKTAKKLLDLVKTADALDRFRQPKLKWRMNTKYLNLLPTAEEVSFAYKFVIETERAFLKGLKNENALVEGFERCSDDK